MLILIPLLLSSLLSHLFSSSLFFFISSLSPFSHFMSFSSSFFSFFHFLILILISSFSHPFSSSFSLILIPTRPLSDLSNKSLHSFNHSIQSRPSFFQSTKTTYIEKILILGESVGQIQYRRFLSITSFRFCDK